MNQWFFTLTLIWVDGMLESVWSLLMFPIELWISIWKWILKTKDEISNWTYFWSELNTIVNIYWYLKKSFKSWSNCYCKKFWWEQS